ncbi:MAG TPA: hypothetical protein PKD79_00475 [Candidatus Doudnabacteria bacterium]|nr:hypothetical protein [Candidatus Doudnabacteria bacterium]
MLFLKNKQHYIDLYDRHTIEECRRILSQPYDGEAIKKELKEKKLDEKEGLRVLSAAYNLYIYFYTGDRYIQKEETIRHWMQVDEAKDKLLEAAQAPEDITCLTCGRLMFVSSKDLCLGIGDKEDRVLFMYECPLKHLPRRAFYNDGQEFSREKPTCPKCRSELIETDKKTKFKLTTLITCPNCDYKDKYEYNFSKKEIEPKPDPNYEKDRARFCLSEKEGQEFINSQENIKQLGRLVDEMQEREKNKDSYDQVAKLKKLKITELQELLVPVLEKAGYIKLQFKEPDTTKDFILPFLVYDHKPDREDRYSTSELEKLLRQTLKETNWRLMTSGVTYRLGMLEGRLHGYVREEDLLRLVKDK